MEGSWPRRVVARLSAEAALHDICRLPPASDIPGYLIQDVCTDAEIERVSVGCVSPVLQQHFSSVPVEEVLLGRREGHKHAEHVEVDDWLNSQYLRSTSTEVGQEAF